MLFLREQLDRPTSQPTEVNMERKKEKVFASIGFVFAFGALAGAACLFTRGSSIDPLHGKNISLDELAITTFGFVLVALVFWVLAWISDD